ADTAGAILDLNNFDQTTGAITGGGGAGGDITLGSGNLTVNSNSALPAYAGVISGTGGLIMTGSGSLTLTGTNNYSGDTTLNSGTLIAGNNALGTGNLFQNSGVLTPTTAAGVINIGGNYTQTGGNLRLTF